MSAESDIRRAIKSMFTDNRDNTFIAEVLSVDINSRTCDVSNIDNDLEYNNVMLQAYVSHSGIVITPKVNSQVLVTMINDTLGHVTMYSEVDLITMNGDSFGGIVKADTLKTELDKTNAVVNAIYSALTTFVPVPGDGGLALKTLAISSLAGKATGIYTSIKNDLIKHGDGIS